MAEKQGQGLETTIKTGLRTSQLNVDLAPLLKMNESEIEERVRGELDSNPALEPKADPDDEGSTPGSEKDEGSTPDDEGESDFDFGNNDDDDNGDDTAPNYRASNHSADDEYYGPTAVEEPTLSDYLMQQVRERDISPEQEIIAQYIVGSLDDNGFLQRSPSAIADDITFSDGRIEVEPADVEAVLKIVRQLDPPGIAATDLRDCILLQLGRMPVTDLVEETIELVDKYFDLLGKKHYDKICASMNIDEHRLRQLIELVRSVNPKPGSGFSGGTSETVRQQITPDYEVDVDGDKLTLTLLNRIPELQISESYTRLYNEYNNTKATSRAQRDTMTDIRDKYNRASNFITLLHMRQQRLFKTMAAIVKRQHDFFVTGDESQLKPMVLKDVARDAGYDVSTISRTTQGKYVTTPWGVYPLKHFFSEGLGEVSTHTVLQALKKLVDDEDKSHPLSDDALCELLNKQGYDVKRRTVAKYRDRLGIAVARLRKTI